ncbi:MAG: EF-hand domain-containing protein [Desulfovibrionaceae bacterium]|nr:EF-hand domain-containing protein [Desulfovibrionaceae bacterium]
MKKLSVSLAFLICMFATAAVAADSGMTEGKHKGDKKKRPSFEDCDKNNAGALTLEEFLACHPRGGEKLFAAMDANKDGKVTREEWQAFREARRTEKLRQIFDQCDKNKDGVLSFEEFEQCKSEHKGKRDGKKQPNKEAGA